jgi:hypothetical protein
MGFIDHFFACGPSRSGMIRWSTDGSECYVEVFGHSGITSDTPIARWVYPIRCGRRDWSQGDFIAPQHHRFAGKRGVLGETAAAYLGHGCVPSNLDPRGRQPLCCSPSIPSRVD